MKLSRGILLKQTIVPLILLAGLISASHAMSAPIKAGVKSPENMNILMICIEDWSAFAVGCYGNPIVKTPHVDALAKKGIMFTRAYCQAPVCNPSRASFCTGLRPDSLKVYGNADHMDQFVPEGVPFISDLLRKKSDVYLAQMGKLVHKWDSANRFVGSFDEVGYTHHYDKPGDAYTGYAFEIKNNPPGVTDAEDEYFFLPDQNLIKRLRQLRKERDDKIAAGHPDNWAVRKPFQQLCAEQVGDSGLSEETMEDGRLSRHAVDRLQFFAKEGKQFFFNVGLYSTHTPLLAPKKYVELYDPDNMPLPTATAEKDNGVPEVAKRFGQNYDIFNGLYPEYGPTEARQKQAIAAYYACATYVDAQVGIILEALKQNGLEDNTIVIFFSDHGFHLGEHGCWSKFTLFEQSTKVPMIVYMPGAAGNGKVCDGIVELTDVLPTMCDLWGVPKSDAFEGTSFMPLLNDPGKPWKKGAFSMITLGGLGRSVRTERYKYAEWRKTTALPSSDEKPQAVELYDLQTDPFEQNNLAGNPEYAKIEKQLRELLKNGWKAALPDAK